MSDLDVSLVAVDRPVWKGTASRIIARTVEGDIGILRGHEPYLALLADGELRIDTADGTLWIAVHGGFFSVDTDVVKILAETAELASEIDIERARTAKQRAIEAGGDDADELAAMERAETRLEVALRAQKGT